MRERSQHADVLIVNGGLGPTSDDLSALAAATVKGEGLVLHRAWLTEMERYFQQRGRVMAPSNRKQAELPASAEFINNPVGTACGFALQLNRCLMFFTPAYRRNLRLWWRNLTAVTRAFSLPEPPLCLRLTTFGRSESDLAQRLDSLPLPPGVTMGYRSSMPIIELKLTGPATQREAMLALWPEVKRVAGQSLIFEGTENLPAQIARRLQERQLSLTLSEQYTSGLLALQLSAPGRLFLPAKSFLLRKRRWRKRHTGRQNDAAIIMPVWRWPCRGWKTNILISRWRRRMARMPYACVLAPIGIVWQYVRRSVR